MDEQSDTRIKKLETLLEINALINSHYKDIKVLLHHIMDSAERLLNSEASSLLLADPASGRLYFEIASGDKGEEIKKYTLEPGEGIAGWVMQNKRPLLVNDTESDPRHFSGIGNAVGYKIRNLVAVPLSDKDTPVGVLEVINKSDGELFDNTDLWWLQALSNQAAIALQNAREFGRMASEIDSLYREQSYNSGNIENLVYNSPIMESVVNTAEKMAESNSPVLLLGESGCGKELLAQRIHNVSSRSQQPMIKVNCAAIPHELVESELFGHVKGAFTDAQKDRKGYFERANGGTLVLDEVGELALSAQAKLLRVLQNGRFSKVGGDSEISVDVHLVAATNKDLESAVVSGTFRQDLYYRLAVLVLRLPPLRERPEDIEILARHFLEKATIGKKNSPKEFSFEALNSLLSYSWPGNVRELQNAIERATIIGIGKKQIEPSDLALPGTISQGTDYSGKTLKDSVTLFKKNYVKEILDANKGNKTEAAHAMGIQRTYLSRLIRELEIGADIHESEHSNRI